MKSNQYKKILMVLALLCYSTNSGASFISYDDSFSTYGSASVGTTGSYASHFSTRYDFVNFARFDDSLGTLLGIDISFTSQWRHQTSVSAVDDDYDEDFFDCDFLWWGCGWTYDNDTSVSSRGEAYFAVQLTDPSGTQAPFHDYDLLSCSDNGWETYTGRSCERDSGYEIGVFNGSLDLSVFDLSDFVGSDDINLQFQNFTYVNATCDDNDSGDYCSAHAYSGWFGSARVTYSYTEFSVPEPGTLALLGIGLFGMGLARRNKKA